MTQLLVDIGNSRIKWARGDPVHSVERGRFSRPETDVEAVLTEAWGGFSPTVIGVCNVAGEAVLDTLRAWTERHLDARMMVLRPQDHLGTLTNGYAQPDTLGADRWANLIAAHRRCVDRDALVVDAGSAVTVDALRRDGRHLGGAILAGRAAHRRGLQSATPALPTGHDHAALPATDTASALGGGTLLGLVGAIERVASAVGADLHAPQRLLTGGDATALAPHLTGEWHIEPTLTLDGVYHGLGLALGADGETPCAG